MALVLSQDHTDAAARREKLERSVDRRSEDVKRSTYSVECRVVCNLGKGSFKDRASVTDCRWKAMTTEDLNHKSVGKVFGAHGVPARGKPNAPSW